ncbi:MAG: hypothetical protein ACYTFA_14875 [Planctomycetota bacterium]
MSSRIHDTPIEVLFEAAGRPEVIQAMRAFYDEADRLIEEKAATCWNKGECCRFGRFGHRLYVTALEVCYYLGCGEGSPTVTADACPHAFEGRCHVRDRRPLGCRIFYCDPMARAWQGPLTEDLLARLRALHDEFNVPYFYADWMIILRGLQSGEVDGTIPRDTGVRPAPRGTA